MKNWIKSEINKFNLYRVYIHIFCQTEFENLPPPSPLFTNLVLNLLIF